MTNLICSFDIGAPYRPFEQLLSVLPKQSCHALPNCYHYLLSDPDSEIIDFYPTDFKLDVNGHRFAWMGVNLLPFVDKLRLLSAMQKHEGELTGSEKKRNSFGKPILFFNANTHEELSKTCSELSAKDPRKSVSFLQKGIPLAGTVTHHEEGDPLGGKISLPIKALHLSVLQRNDVVSVGFFEPDCEDHMCSLLGGAALPPLEVKAEEINQGDRRAFFGETALRTVERCLGIRRDNENVLA